LTHAIEAGYFAKVICLGRSRRKFLALGKSHSMHACCKALSLW
jgi:hypothetical protein